MTTKIAKPLYQFIYEEHVEGKGSVPDNICNLLALITVCEKWNDWHWEREWRIVGDLVFELDDVHCGLCPEDDIPYFEDKYSGVVFISPHWGINRILDKLVKRK